MVLYNMINIWNHAQRDLFAMTVWMIWNQRNQIWHRIPSCNTDQLAQVAIERLNEFVAGLPPTNPAPQKSKVVWKPPPTGMFKLNFDGAVFKQENKSSVGIAIWDCKGLALQKTVLLRWVKITAKTQKSTAKGTFDL